VLQLRVVAHPASVYRVRWVGIVAGTVFILGAIFVAGAATSWNNYQQQAISMPQKGDPPPAGPTDGDKCCCEKMAKK